MNVANLRLRLENVPMSLLELLPRLLELRDELRRRRVLVGSVVLELL